MRTVIKSNTERDFFSFMSKRRKYSDVLPVLAQNKSVLLAHSDTKNQNKREYLPLFGFYVTMPLPRKAPDVTKEQNYIYAIVFG